MLRGANGACVVFDEKKKVSMYFCSKHVPPEETVYFVKVDKISEEIPSVKSGHHLVLENIDSRSKMKLEFDDVYYNRTISGYVTTYMWFVPEVFINLFRQDLNVKFTFHIDNRDYIFKFNKEQKNQFRFIANFESIKEEDQ